MKKDDKKIKLLKRQQRELVKRMELENEAIELISQRKFEMAQGVLASIGDGALASFERELDALEKEMQREPLDNIPDEPMELGLESIEGKNFVLLDGKRMHHVRKYSINNKLGLTELSIKMLVKFSEGGD